MRKIRIGIDVGGTNIEACGIPQSTDTISDIVFAHRPYPKGAKLKGLCNVLLSLVDEIAEAFSVSFSDVINIGIATPGSLDVNSGVIVHAYNLGLDNAGIIAEMQKLIPDVPMHLINDADAAALGEYNFGALCGVNSGCLITLGTGVGAGLIIDGKLYRGGKMRGTELGHMTLDINGEKCTCGNNGCIETLCSATYLAKEGKKAYGKDVSAKDIADMARSGDVKAITIFARYIENLSAALSTYMTLLDPERIVIGGGVSMAGDILFVPLLKRTADKCFFSPIGEIVPAKLGNKAGAIGAAFAQSQQ